MTDKCYAYVGDRKIEVLRLADADFDEVLKNNPDIVGVPVFWRPWGPTALQFWPAPHRYVTCKLEQA